MTFLNFYGPRTSSPELGTAERLEDFRTGDAPTFDEVAPASTGPESRMPLVTCE